MTHRHPSPLAPAASRLGFLGVLVALAVLAGSMPAAATTIAPVADAELVDQAQLVLEGTVRERREGAAGPYTDYAIDVERVLKGELLGRSVLVRLPGGPSREGPRLHVWGAPQLQPAERVLVFLAPRRDGTWGLLHFTLGAFRGIAGDGRLLARRDLEEVHLLAEDGEQAPGVEPTAAGRDFVAFAHWIADRARGVERPADYFVEDSGPRSRPAPYTYIGGIRQRWLEFDGGQGVSWRAHQNGQPNVPGSGFGAFQSAIDAWNGDGPTNIRYRYDGTTSNSTGFQRFDGQNVILFEDPNGEVEGVFTCSIPGRGSGVLAIGGTWFDDDDPEPVPIQGGDIIVNDGSSCWFSTEKRAEQVYAHELGHTLGLGHSCGDGNSGICNTDAKRQALMRATAHDDDRGASFSQDDRDGIFDLYGGGAVPKPAAPTNLVATATSASAVALAWTDNASNETSFQVQMKTAGSGFDTVENLAADVVTTSVTGLAPATTYTFRVRARNGGSSSAFSNEAAATTPPLLVPPAAPANLSATPLADGSIQLAWQDKSSNEDSFHVEMSSPAGPFAEVTSAAAGATGATIAGLPADTPHTFRVRARNAAGNSAFSKEASATTAGAGAPCAADASTLCVRDGRFRVRVQWRVADGGATGQAGALPLTDEAGMFWFFSQDNVELIVKILDGTPVNDFFWTFFGALSDVEYWISVTDVTTLAGRTYHNPPGAICGGADTASLPGPSHAAVLPIRAPAPAIVPVKEAACAPDTLCLLDGRFQVEVAWETGEASGAGTPVPVSGSDATGLFWFFSPENIELVVKAIDATAFNGRYWIFYGALSDVAYEIKVTDTLTQAVRTYDNAQGNLCGQADTSAF